jgi:hypothetical protein
VLIGMSLVFFVFPRKDEEEALRASYHADDIASARASEPPTLPQEAAA